MSKPLWRLPLWLLRSHTCGVYDPRTITSESEVGERLRSATFGCGSFRAIMTTADGLVGLLDSSGRIHTVDPNKFTAFYPERQ